MARGGKIEEGEEAWLGSIFFDKASRFCMKTGLPGALGNRLRA